MSYYYYIPPHTENMFREHMLSGSPGHHAAGVDLEVKDQVTLFMPVGRFVLQ